MDSEEDLAVPSKLPRHVEQASTARTARRARACPKTGEGGAAQELLGDEHGAAWDMLDWVHQVLGTKASEGGVGAGVVNATAFRPLTRQEYDELARTCEMKVLLSFLVRLRGVQHRTTNDSVEFWDWPRYLRLMACESSLVFVRCLLVELLVRV